MRRNTFTYLNSNAVGDLESNTVGGMKSDDKNEIGAKRAITSCT